MVFSAVRFSAFWWNILALWFLHFQPTGFNPTDQTQKIAQPILQCGKACAKHIREITPGTPVFTHSTPARQGYYPRVERCQMNPGNAIDRETEMDIKKLESGLGSWFG